MIRQDIIDNYKLSKRGIIQTPGKFEGEMLYAPYFYDAMLDGEGRETLDGSIDIAITKEDIEQFPELLGDIETINIVVDNNGFVYCTAF